MRMTLTSVPISWGGAGRRGLNLTVPLEHLLPLESTVSGFKFPDETVQTTAATSEVQNFFQAASGVEISPGTTWSQSDFADVIVPAGYRAIVEFASVECVTPPGNPVLLAGLGMIKRGTIIIRRPFLIPIVYQGQNSTTAFYVAGLSTRLYSDEPNVSQMNSQVHRTSGDGTTQCSIFIIGRILPIPPGELLPAV